MLTFEALKIKYPPSPIMKYFSKSRIIKYITPKGVKQSELKDVNEYLFKGYEHKNYEYVWSYHCQGDFCKRYLTKIEIL